MGRTIGIIQARMGSERLPGKILAPLAGRPMLALLAARVRPARVDEWWLATSTLSSDDVTAAWGSELGLRVYRGDATNVLSRFLAVADATEAEWLVRVTADNPFLDAPPIDALLDARDASGAAKRADKLALAGALPLGYGAELVRADALARAAHEIPASAPHHRVHVTSWLAVHGAVHGVAAPADWPARAEWRWTVDTPEDLAMARQAYRGLGERAATIDYRELVARLDAQPGIPAINAHVAQKRVEEG
ncbi:MAG: NTP transferase domain-containing protein [Spirochaetaceae bacterium]|nr:NTP transferase domain-containing protein [Myxococcales bacterium]MCB9723931.1 NTP transferase domain-containing protein [Spirochaetaceae bacterium]HPG27858.1 NTP transferase domain-containing protein [Myxococcota bacterium]